MLFILKTQVQGKIKNINHKSIQLLVSCFKDNIPLFSRILKLTYMNILKQKEKEGRGVLVKTKRYKKGRYIN